MGSCRNKILKNDVATSHLLSKLLQQPSQSVTFYVFIVVHFQERKVDVLKLPSPPPPLPGRGPLGFKMKIANVLPDSFQKELAQFHFQILSN